MYMHMFIFFKTTSLTISMCSSSRIGYRLGNIVMIMGNIEMNKMVNQISASKWEEPGHFHCHGHIVPVTLSTY